MARSTRLRMVVALSLLVLAAIATGTRAASADECREAISSDHAKTLFEALKRRADDGCELTSLRTEGSAATVLWKRDGVVQEGVVVTPTSCVNAPTLHGTVLSASVPSATAKACPASVRALGALLESDAFGVLVRLNGERPPTASPQRPAPWLWMALAGAAVALTGAIVGARAFARSRGPASGWLAAFACSRGPASGWLAAFARSRSRPERAKRVAAWWSELSLLVRRSSSLAWAAMTPKPRQASLAGWGAAALLGPHVLLGTWLVVVPDHAAFTASQVITLVHVVLAVGTLPLACGWVLWHVRGSRGSRVRAEGFEKAVRWGLLLASLGAAVTGASVMYGGTIASTATLHAVSGVAVGVPLAAHLWLSARRAAALVAASLLVVGASGGSVARRLLPPSHLEAEVPDFAFATHPEDRYERAESCGECHVEDYQDWKRSTHARTLELANVREAMERQPNLLHEDLHHIGQLIAERERPLDAALVFGACGSCHAPTSFYGDGKPSLLEPAGLTAEGVGCSFCHTVRAVRRDRDTSWPVDPGATSMSNGDIFAIMSRAPLFVSAPETVRRYLGQGSRSPLARRVANWLIRWRPEIHAKDYHSPVLDDSRACLPCHSLGLDAPQVPHMTYFSWEKSSFNTGDPKTTVECQDCHMSRHATGEPVNEMGRAVPWGPRRPRARSHLLLGGNVHASRTLGDEPLARAQHEINLGVLAVDLVHAAREGDVLRVKVAVRSEKIGHDFPALETKTRYGWVELAALDAGGKVVARTPRPRDSDDFGSAAPLIMASTDDVKPDTQRTVRAGSSRQFDARIVLPSNVQVVEIIAELHDSVDPEPLATSVRPLRELL